MSAATASPSAPGSRPRRRLVAAAAAVVALVAGPGLAAGSLTTSDAAPGPLKAAVVDETPPFRVATFNVLGHSHTAKGGNKPGWPGSGPRMRRTVTLLTERNVSVVGLQEFQMQQYAKLRELVGTTWAVYPGNRLDHMAMQNSLAWRKDQWKRVHAKTIAIPYFDGHPVQMPVVLLRNKATQRMVWFANFHNPTDGAGHGSQRKWREIAKARQVALANRLWATGLPVIFTGDMNESTRFFCTLAAGAPLKAPSGGAVTDQGCTPPPLRGIDWILGSVDVSFTGFVMENTPFVKRTSDHPFVYADVVVPDRPRG